MSPPIQPSGIDHVVLLVDDMQQTTDFYTKVLGCTVDNDMPKFGMRQLRAGEALIDLVDIGSPEGAWARPEIAGGRNVDHIALALRPADSEAVRRHLAEKGVAIVEEGDRVGALGDTLSFYVTDPSGNQIELSFPPA